MKIEISLGCVTSDREIKGGIICLSGTRFPAGQIFAELAAGLDVEEIAGEYDVSREQVKQLLKEVGFALSVVRPK